MQTTFSAVQLADPAIREADAILRKCVHCGFCNSACPTFALTGDELDGPRGRIYLIKNLLERGARPTPGVTRHLDRCLSCLACSSACPSGVDYMHLADHGRAFVEKRAQRGLFDRAARAWLAAVLPNPSRLRMLARAGHALRRHAPLLPGRIGDWLRALPFPQPGVAGADTAPRSAGQATPRARIALLPGCVQQVFGVDVNAATVRVLERAGYGVELLRGSPCCGAIEQHLGKHERALRRIRANVRDWAPRLSRGEFGAIVVNASGCGTMLKDYAHLLHEDPELAAPASAISACAADLAELLREIPWQAAPGRDPRTLKVAYQSPCSMQHGQKLGNLPQSLLRRAGFTVVEPDDAHACCGSAGTYNLLQPELASRLGRAKADRLRATGADVIASGNLGCMLQTRRYLVDIPVLHTAQLLDWVGGGPAPDVLTAGRG